MIEMTKGLKGHWSSQNGAHEFEENLDLEYGLDYHSHLNEGVF